MTVQAKFVCRYIDEPIYIKQSRETHPQLEHEECRVVHLSAVRQDEDDNNQWSKWTPSGDIQMYVTNPAAFAEYEVGASYILTFERV